jgi:hypothetical protein
LCWQNRFGELICLVVLLVNEGASSEIDDMTEASDADMLNWWQLFNILLKNANHLIVAAVVVTYEGPDTVVGDIVLFDDAQECVCLLFRPVLLRMVG